MVLCCVAREGATAWPCECRMPNVDGGDNGSLEVTGVADALGALALMSYAVERRKWSCRVVVRQSRRDKDTRETMYR